MKILLLGVGKTKFDYLNEGIDRFVKMTKPFAKIELKFLKEQATKPNCVELESDSLLKSIPSGYTSILMDIDGKAQSSQSFAKLLDIEKSRGRNICFIIGGHSGVSDLLKSVVDQRISFSKLTFTHQMVRLLLVEQIYRGYSILNNLNYHK